MATFRRWLKADAVVAVAGLSLLFPDVCLPVKALFSSRGAYLTSGLMNGGLIREGSLIKRGGCLFQIFKHVLFK